MDDNVLATFEQLTLNQTKSFLRALGADELEAKITDIASIQKNAAVLVLISYTRTFGRSAGQLQIKLNMDTERDHFDNLQHLINAVMRKYTEFAHGAEPPRSVTAEAILRGDRAHTALAIHSLVHILSQLHLVHVLSLDPHGSGSGGVAGLDAESVGSAEDDGKQIPPKGREYTEMKGSATGGVRDAVSALEDEATQYFDQVRKQKAAARRRKHKKEQKLIRLREKNAESAERMRMMKLFRQEKDLELMNLAYRLRYDSEQESRVHFQMEGILRALNQEAQEDDELNTEYLKKLEQDRISQAASASRLFRDRAQMIEGYTDKMRTDQSTMLTEQERFMEALLRDAAARQKVTLDNKVQQMKMIEDAFLHQSMESQYALAKLFNVNTHEYVVRDRTIGVAASPFESTLKNIRSNALTLRTQQRKRWKARKLSKAYANVRPATR